MIYKFDDDVINQINFYYKNQHNICDFTEYDENLYKNHTDNVRIFRYAHEIISNISVKNEIIGYIKELRNSGKDAYLTTATITRSKYEFHPLVSIHLHWYDYYMRTGLSWKIGPENSITAFSTDRYDYTKKFTFNKSIKSIISVRKEVFDRNILFKKISPDDNSIFRYARYLTNPNKETQSDLEYSNNFPTWSELQDEYDNSIFSFIVETENGGTDCQISEKTLLAFMSGTIPIIYGQPNVVKLLKDIGLYVWNDEFGFRDGDDSYDYNYRLDRFVDCYNNIKKLSFEDSKNYWLDNQSTIQKNYDIISNLIVKKWN